MIQQTIDLDMIPGNTLPVIHVNQNDTGEDRLIFNLKKRDAVFSTAGDVKLQGTTPTGTFRHNMSAVSFGVFKCDLYADMTSASGDVFCQVVATSNYGRIGSQIFILRVQEEA